jgi:hypothetical protein
MESIKYAPNRGFICIKQEDKCPIHYWHNHPESNSGSNKGHKCTHDNLYCVHPGPFKRFKNLKWESYYTTSITD